MHEWSNAQIFERVSNIYNFSKNPLSQKNILKHIFIPWSEDHISDLMFQIKAEIVSKKKCLIPYMDGSLNPLTMPDQDIASILEQIKNGIETHLVMSNFDSIHIFKIDNIVINNKPVDTIAPFSEKDGHKSRHNYWIEVSDLYVFKANHLSDESQNKEMIFAGLDELLKSNQVQTFFSPVQKVNITSNTKEEKKGESLNWIELNRNLTYDYFIRSCELEENIYQDSWTSLTRQTRHCLVSSEQSRHKAIQYQNGEKFLLLKESFEQYMSAFLNELNVIYLTPLLSNFYRFNCLLEEWEDIESGLINKELKTILDEQLKNKTKQIDSLESFLIYIRNIKTCIFTIKRKFTKRISKEEHLQIENFLSRQENLAESFICRGLDFKIERILDIKNWICNLNDSYESLCPHELSDLTLKLTHLLSIMSATSYEDNIFFKIIEEKTSKGLVRRSFEDEVNQLTKTDIMPQVKIAA